MAVSCLERRPRPPSSRPRRTDAILGPCRISPLIASASCWPDCGDPAARGKVRVTDGFAACASQVPVKVQKRVSGAWKTIKSVKTSSSGKYSAKLPDKPGKYRSLAPKVMKGTDICGKAKSPTRMH